MQEETETTTTVSEIYSTLEGKSMRLRRGVSPYLFIAPALITLIAVSAYPLGYDLYMSLTDFHLARPTSINFVGLENFFHAFREPSFVNSLRVTLMLAGISLSMELSIGLAIAILLTKPTRGKRLIESLVILPMFVPPVVIGLVWKYMYQQGYGIIPFCLNSIGITTGTGLLTESSTALLSLIVVEVWITTGFVVLLLLAGLRNLPREPIEAAQIDGATRSQIFAYIILPLLRPVIIIVLVLRTVDVFKIFDIIYVLTGGGPGEDTEVISYFVYRSGIRLLKMGYAAAVMFIFMGIVLGICILISKIGRIEPV